MYQAKITVGVEHRKQTVTPDFYDGLRDLFREEAKIVNPKVDFMSTYVLGGDTGTYINHNLEIHLYGETLYVDPEEFFKQVFDGVKTKSGKDMFFIGEVETDVPDEDTRICPTCSGNGWYYKANHANNKVVQDCGTCETKKRVIKEVADSAKPALPVVYRCQKYCIAVPRETIVPEGEISCDNCKMIIEKTKQTQKVRNEEWVNSLVEMEVLKKISNQEENLNHLKALKAKEMKLRERVNQHKNSSPISNQHSNHLPSPK
jgi:hypothetical protein